MATWRDLCTDAAAEINLAAVGQDLDAADIALIFSRALDILDEWKAVRQMIFQVTRNLFATVAGTASYLIGPAATWNAPVRPEGIVAAGFVNTTVNPADPLETEMLPYTERQWAQVPIKTMQSTVCERYWYETSVDGSGFAKFFPYPVPSVAAQIALYLPIPLTDPATIDTTIVMPPAYKRAIRTELAIDICDPFEKVPSAVLIKKNRQAKRALTGANAKPGVLELPWRLLRRSGGYNILTNQGG